MHQDVETVGILSACVCVCVKLGAHTGTAETISAAERLLAQQQARFQARREASESIAQSSKGVDRSTTAATGGGGHVPAPHPTLGRGGRIIAEAAILRERLESKEGQLAQARREAVLRPVRTKSNHRIL